MKPPAAWTRKRRRGFARRWDAWCAGARRSSLRTGSPLCKAPTGFSYCTRDAFGSPERTRSCWPRAEYTGSCTNCSGRTWKAECAVRIRLLVVLALVLSIAGCTVAQTPAPSARAEIAAETYPGELRDLEIARRYAPVFYQRLAGEGADRRFDYITNFDF